MALFGGSRRKPSFDGLVATREDEERARRLESVLGGSSMIGSMSRGMQSMLPTVSKANQFEPQLPDFQVGERQPQPMQVPA